MLRVFAIAVWESLVSLLAPHAGSRPFYGPGTTGPVDTNVFSPLSNARVLGPGRRRELRVSQRK